MSNKSLIGGAIGVAALLILGSNFILNGSVLPDSNTNQINVNNQHQVNTTVSKDLKLAPDFSLKTLEGKTIKLSDYIGKKPVVLDFFATWCPNCQRDMPRLSKIYDTHKNEVEVIGINLQENKKTVEDFIVERKINFPIVLDSQSSVSRNYGVRYTNYHVLISKKGSIINFVPGDIKESDIIELINI